MPIFVQLGLRFPFTPPKRVAIIHAIAITIVNAPLKGPVTDPGLSEEGMPTLVGYYNPPPQKKSTHEIEKSVGPHNSREHLLDLGCARFRKMSLVLDGCSGRKDVFLIVIVFVLIQLLTNWCK